MAKKTKTYQAPSQEEIAALAHEIYEREGRPEGRDMEHWLLAEAELTAKQKVAVGTILGKNSKRA